MIVGIAFPLTLPPGPGATIVAPCAGEMISELTVAMQADIGLGTLGRVVHPYPTIAEAIKGCGIR